MWGGLSHWAELGTNPGTLRADAQPCSMEYSNFICNELFALVAQDGATGNRFKLCLQGFFYKKINYFKISFINIIPRAFCGDLWHGY